MPLKLSQKLRLPHSKLNIFSFGMLGAFLSCSYSTIISSKLCLYSLKLDCGGKGSSGGLALLLFHLR
jgi:hypothetical protein